MMRILTFILMAALLAGAQAQTPARIGKARAAVPAAKVKALRSALSDAKVRAELSRNVRRMRVDPEALEAYAGPEYDLRNIRSDATEPAPARISPAQIKALMARPARRPAAGVKIVAPQRVRPLPGGAKLRVRPKDGATRFTPPAPSRPGSLKLPPKPTLDVNAFGQQLHATLSPNVAGYMMRLRRNGKTIYTLQWNWAQTPVDAGFGWNPNRRMHIASVSKLITAIAMTRLLDEKNISYDAKIISYLPAYWQKGPNIGSITFRHLMTHTSGISTGGSGASFQFAKQRIAMGVPAAAIGTGDYENVNFSLQRVLIATVGGYVNKNTNFGLGLNDILWDALTNSAYVTYVKAKVFAPAGVNGPTLNKPAGPAFAYVFNGSGGGWNSGNLTSLSGGVGWHMSVDEVLNVMGALRRGGKIMPFTKAQGMLNAGFGVDSGVNGVSTSAGRLYHKNGRWLTGNRQEQCVAFFLPDGMELVVFVNSDVGAANTFLRTLVQQLYVNNIVSP